MWPVRYLKAGANNQKVVCEGVGMLGGDVREEDRVSIRVAGKKAFGGGGPQRSGHALIIFWMASRAIARTSGEDLNSVAMTKGRKYMSAPPISSTLWPGFKPFARITSVRGLGWGGGWGIGSEREGRIWERGVDTKTALTHGAITLRDKVILTTKPARGLLAELRQAREHKDLHPG